MKDRALSPNFGLLELVDSPTARRDPAVWALQVAPPDEVVDWLDRLARDALQPIRDEVDWPIIVRSGYRSESLNRMIPGASKTSQHVLGQAADIQAAPGLVKARPGLVRRVSERLSRRMGRGARVALSRNGVLWALLALGAREYGLNQLIHEYGPALGAPAWVHVAVGGSKRGRLSIKGAEVLGHPRYAHFERLRDLGSGFGYQEPERMLG